MIAALLHRAATRRHRGRTPRPAARTLRRRILRRPPAGDLPLLATVRQAQGPLPAAAPIHTAQARTADTKI